MTDVISPSLTPSRRVLSRDEAIALGRRLLSLVNETSIGVSIDHMSTSVTKIIDGTRLMVDDGDAVTIRFDSLFGVGMPVTIQTNQLNDEMLHQVVARAEAMKPPKRITRTPPLDDSDMPDRYTYNDRPFPAVNLWYDTTIHAMDEARRDVVPSLVDELQDANLNGAATVGCTAHARLYLYKHGLTAFCDETDAEVTVTARTRDNMGSGWNGQAHRDWSKIRPNDVATRAIAIANRMRNPVACEPGHYTVILGPAAVAQLVTQMNYAFEGRETRSGASSPDNVLPFGYFDSEESRGRHTKLGMRVFDARLRMVSDPADPLGGYPPFFEEQSFVEQHVWGFPLQRMTWIDAGVLQHLAEDVSESAKRRILPNDTPHSVRLEAMPGTPIATIDEMIANCQFGIYVNRFSDAMLVHRPSGMMTGVTRDGTFLVRNGKIEKPIKNLRFLESPFFAFNKIEMLGAPERVAFGYGTPPNPWDAWQHWPRLPVIVPPLMIQDFNFSAMADAV